MEKLTFNYILIQLIGFCAMAFGILSFQAKRRNTILLMQMTASILWAVQYLLLGAYTGVALNLVSIFRNLFFTKKGKSRLVDSRLFPIAVMTVFFIAGIATYDGAISLFPTAAMMISTIALYITEERSIRLLSLLVSPLWLIYNIKTGALAGAICETITLISIIVALIRYRKVKSQN